MIGPQHLRVLRVLFERLKETDINWAVTGSCSFALQGLPIEPNDIDIQADEPGAYAIEQLFFEFVIRRVTWSSTPIIRSHFGALEIAGVKVEIMGDIQKREADGSWDEPPTLDRYKRFVEVDGMRIPILALDYEHTAYLKMGRIEKAEMLRAWLESH